jgi:3-oxoacyl-[acyl-carrier protein] reductase
VQSNKIGEVPKERVLVTGASRGIGRAITIGLAAAGYDIAIHFATNIDGAKSVASEIASLGANSFLLQFDISDRERTRDILENDINTNGAYYGVVCNAGISSDATFPMLSGNDWDRVINTNLNGFYNVLAPIVLPMIRRRAPGRIVTISSVAGQIGNRGQVNYSASKAGIIGATKALALDLARRKITVNCIAPGLIETDMTRTLPLEPILEHVPLGRLGQPEEIAGLVCFLMTADAAYITRQVIAVNGGMS